MKPLLLFIVLGLMSCQSNPSEIIRNIDGYWEIEQVKKNGDVVKSFKINPNIDHFTINNNRTSGQRKKLTPRFDGSFETSQDVLHFKIEILENDVFLIYSNAILTLKERVELATEKQLILTNSEGFKYTYKPYEPLQLNE